MLSICPNCKNNLAFLDIYMMSKRNYFVICRFCGDPYKVSKKAQLFAITFAFAMAALSISFLFVLFRNFLDIYMTSNYLNIISIATILILCSIILVYFYVYGLALHIRRKYKRKYKNTDQQISGVGL